MLRFVTPALALALVGCTTSAQDVVFETPGTEGEDVSLQVAWADGEIQDEERTLLIQAARSQGIEEGTPPDLVFLDLLKSRPTQQFYDAALTYVRAALAAMDSPTAAAEARADLTSLAKQVALVHGKLFGMFGSGVSDPERDALDEIAGKLTAAHPMAASSVVEAIGAQDDD